MVWKKIKEKTLNASKKGLDEFADYSSETINTSRKAYDALLRPRIELEKQKLKETKRMVKENLKFKKALSNIKAARVLLRQNLGWKALINPQYIALGVRAGIVMAVPLLIAVIVFALLCYIWLYTLVAPIYFFYGLSATVSAIINIPIIILNAILFATNAVSEAIKLGVATIINRFAIWLLTPIVNVVNTIIDGVNTVVGQLKLLGVDITVKHISAPGLIPQKEMTINLRPKYMFAYFMPPDNLHINPDGTIDLLSAFAFVMVKPGGQVYLHGEANDLYVTEYAFGTEPPLSIYIPKMNPFIVTQTFITESYKPPPTYTFPGFIIPDPEVYTWIIVKPTIDSSYMKVVNKHNIRHLGYTTNVRKWVVSQAFDVINPVGDYDHDGIRNFVDDDVFMPANRKVRPIEYVGIRFAKTIFGSLVP